MQLFKTIEECVDYYLQERELRMKDIETWINANKSISVRKVNESRLTKCFKFSMADGGYYL